MRYSRSALAWRGCGQTLPSLIFEFFGRVNWTIAFLLSVNPGFRLDIRHVVGQRVSVHRPVIDRDFAGLVEPGQRVLHPVLVVAVGEIFARMGAAALGAVGRG